MKKALQIIGLVVLALACFFVAAVMGVVGI